MVATMGDVRLEAGWEMKGKSEDGWWCVMETGWCCCEQLSFGVVTSGVGLRRANGRVGGGGQRPYIFYGGISALLFIVTL